MRERAAHHVMHAVLPRLRHQHSHVGGDEDHDHGPVIASSVGPVRARVPIGDRIEEGIDAEVMRHVLRGEHQAK